MTGQVVWTVAAVLWGLVALELLTLAGLGVYWWWEGR
jgi:hypothetical protein